MGRSRSGSRSGNRSSIDQRLQSLIGKFERTAESMDDSRSRSPEDGRIGDAERGKRSGINGLKSKNQVELCIPYTMDGSCQRGNECPERHLSPTSRADAKRDLQKKPCRYGAECRRADCVFYHPYGKSTKGNISPRPARSRSAPRKRDSRSPAPKQSRRSPPPGSGTRISKIDTSNLCIPFTSQGFCKRDENCRLRHLSPESRDLAYTELCKQTCRDGNRCRRADCIFVHPAGKMSMPVNSSSKPCRFGADCKRADCMFSHPGGNNRRGASKERGRRAASPEMGRRGNEKECRYGRMCKRPDCIFWHPNGKGSYGKEDNGSRERSAQRKVYQEKGKSGYSGEDRGGAEYPRRKELCIQYTTSGSCKMGNDCPSRHLSPRSRREAQAELYEKPCRFGRDCKRSDCVFKHPGDKDALAIEDRAPRKLAIEDRAPRSPRDREDSRARVKVPPWKKESSSGGPATSERKYSRSRTPQVNRNQAKKAPAPEREYVDSRRDLAGRERVELCISFTVSGSCKAGNDCPSRHLSPRSRQEAQKDLAKKPCRWGAECKRADCVFSHPGDERKKESAHGRASGSKLRRDSRSRSPKYRTPSPRREKGTSNRKDSRSRNEGKEPFRGERAELCIPFTVNGHCKVGNDCPARHLSPESRKDARASLRFKPCRYGEDCKRSDCVFGHPG